MKIIKKISSFIALLVCAATFNTHKTHAMEPEKPSSSVELPLEMYAYMIDLLTKTSTATTVQEAGKIINTLARTNSELNALINDPQFCLRFIKNLAQQFKCSDQEAAEALQTQEAKKRLKIQEQFYNLCENFNEQEFDLLYEKYKEYVDLNFIYIIDSKFTTTLLISAAEERTNNCHLIQILLNCGANINKTISDGTTALMGAIIWGHVDNVLCLLNNPKIAIDQQSNFGETALLFAAIKDDEHILQILLNHGAKINKADQRGTTALMIAADNNYIEIVQHLLKNLDITIDQQNNRGQTALMLAIGRKNKQIIQLLLAAGADPELANYKGLTPLQAAQQKGDQEIINLIQEAIEKKHEKQGK